MSMLNAALLDATVLHPACHTIAFHIKAAFKHIYPLETSWLKNSRPKRDELEKFWTSKDHDIVLKQE